MFDIGKFKVLYIDFEDLLDSEIEVIAEDVACLIGQCRPECHDKLWMLATAHALHLREKWSEEGAAPTGAITSASVGSVSVGFSVLGARDNSEQWFTLSHYGREYLALFERCKTRVKYIGGSGWGRRYR